MLDSTTWILLLCLLAAIVALVLAGVLRLASNPDGAVNANAASHGADTLAPPTVSAPVQPSSLALTARARRKLDRRRRASLRDAFGRMFRRIDPAIGRYRKRDSVPLAVVLEEGFGRDAVDGDAFVDAEYRAGEMAQERIDVGDGIVWRYLEGGVVAELPSAYLAANGDDEDAERAWDAFLTQCQKHRPQRPIDAIVVRLPAALLLDATAQARHALQRRGRRMHRLISLAQHRFATRFALYLVIDHCECVEGFTAWASSVPQDMLSNLLGWSSPFDVESPYQPHWIDLAFDEIAGTVAEVGAEACANGINAGHAMALLSLPARLASLGRRLPAYAEALMLPAAFDAAFLLRGIYLSGNVERPAQTPVHDGSQIHGAHAADPHVEAGGASGTIPAPDSDDCEPAFAHDLFERKVLCEIGLTAPLPARLSGGLPAWRTRVWRWSIVLMLTAWSTGLTIAGWQTAQRSREWVAGLEQLQPDAPHRTAFPILRDERAVPGPSWYRDRAVTLLRMMNAVRPSTTAVWFMPGAWPIVDGLAQRAAQYVRHAFGTMIVAELNRALIARVDDLTQQRIDRTVGSSDTSRFDAIDAIDTIDAGGGHGANHDEATRVSALPNGAMPPAMDLAISHQPEMLALQSYLGQVDRLAAALAALQRVQQSDQPTSADLRAVIRYAFGVDLPDDLSLDLPVFHRETANASLNGDAALGDIDWPRIQYAAREALQADSNRLRTALFIRNPLLRDERTLQSALTALQTIDATPSADMSTLSARQIHQFRQIVDAVQAQQALVATGTGNWMRPGGDLGDVVDPLLEQVRRNPLLGPQAAQQLHADFDTSLQAFRASFSNAFATRTAGADSSAAYVSDAADLPSKLGDSGNPPDMAARNDSDESNDSAIGNQSIHWDAAAGHFVVSPARLALRDAVMDLLNQPFMTQQTGNAFASPLYASADANGDADASPSPPCVLVWDAAQLDQAIALDDTRTRYLSQAFSRVSPQVRAMLVQAVNRQFTALLMDKVASSAQRCSLGAPGMNAAVNASSPGALNAFRAVQPKLAKIVALLNTWGAAPQAAVLAQRLSADALIRLRSVDAALGSAGLYSVSSQTAPIGTSGQALLSAAFDVADTPSLLAYLKQQAAQVQTFGSQASVYLAALSPDDSASPVAQRWIAINQDLAQYALKDPNSDLRRLEQFLLSLSGGAQRSGAHAAGPDCTTALAPESSFSDAAALMGNDYFAGVRQRLTMQLSMRCTDLRASLAHRRWVAFAAAFNASLAGRSPFGAAADAQITVDPAQLPQVIARFDALAQTMGWPAADPVSGNGSASPVDATASSADSLAAGRLPVSKPLDHFMHRFATVATFLRPLVAPASSTGGSVNDGAATGYDLDVDFRVDRQAEVNGNQIIAWSLQSGTQTIDDGMPHRRLRWRYGMPLTFTLRLAKNAPTSAVDDPHQPHMSTDGRAVTWSFPDPWALMTFLNEHRVSEHAAGIVGQSVLLGFSFPLTPAVPPASAGQHASAAAPHEVHVFIRMVLTVADQHTPLPWPGAFPTHLPTWSLQ